MLLVIKVIFFFFLHCLIMFVSNPWASIAFKLFGESIILETSNPVIFCKRKNWLYVINGCLSRKLRMEMRYFFDQG